MPGLDVFGSSPSAANEGSGVAATQTRAVAPFDSVRLAGSNNVVIRVGDEQSVVVKADDNLIDRITTEVHSGELVIEEADRDFSTSSPTSVEVTVPTLAALTLAGSGNIVVDDLAAARLDVALPGSGTLTGSGLVTRLDVTVDGSGTVMFTRVAADDVHAAVNGSGSILLTATKSLDASVSGSGAILYTGNPHDVVQSISGTGAITAT